MNRTGKIELSNFNVKEIDVDKTLLEINNVKKQVDKVRFEIQEFIRLIAGVEDATNENEFFHQVSFKLFELRQQLADYLTKYNNLIPLMELSHQASGFNSQQFEVANLNPLLSDRKRQHIKNKSKTANYRLDDGNLNPELIMNGSTPSQSIVL